MFSLFRTLFEEDELKIKTNEVKEGTMNIPCLLSEDESLQANEAKERTLRILSDALKKKKSLLVEDPKEFGDKKMTSDWPLITTDLVKQLIRELEKVTFVKNTDPEHDDKNNAYVYPGSDDRTIYLCALFWKMDPESKSQQCTIIHEVSHFLGYGHTVQENSDRVQKSPQSMLCPLTAFSVSSALTSSMDHTGTYTNGSYSCCGETSKDTVCEKSMTAAKQRCMCKMHSDMFGELTYSSEEDSETDPSVEDLDTTDDEIDTAGLTRFMCGTDLDMFGEKLYSFEEESQTDTSAEDSDTTDEEVEAAAEKNTAMQLLVAQILIMKKHIQLAVNRIPPKSRDERNILFVISQLPLVDRLKRQILLVMRRMPRVKSRILFTTEPMEGRAARVLRHLLKIPTHRMKRRARLFKVQTLLAIKIAVLKYMHMDLF